MIELINVTKIFNGGRPNEFVATRGVSLTIREKEVTVLKGPSGSGKTTLLSLMGCMARPTSGRIMLRGTKPPGAEGGEGPRDFEVTSLPERFLAEIRRQTFGFIFQQFNLIRGITVMENVILPAYPCGENHDRLREKAMDLLRLFNVGHRSSARIEWLSGGEAQRVTIARALINDPSFIIADEPTAHLDTKLSREFLDIVTELKAEGKTMIIASHDPLVYESAVVDRVVHVRDGEIVAGG